MRVLISIFFVVLMLSGCEQKNPVTTMPDLTFEHIDRAVLKVTDFEVRNYYTPPLAEPNVEHLFPTPLYRAVEDFLGKSIAPTGGRHQIEFVLKEASVIKKKLPAEGTIYGYFHKAPTERYEGYIFVIMNLYQGVQKEGSMKIEVRKNLTLYEGTTPYQREEAFLKMTEDMVIAMDDAFKEIIDKKLPELSLVTPELGHDHHQ